MPSSLSNAETTAPGWLKAMENGAIGEARAKALLLERFWVLDRSVDVDGADYLIQRRLTRETFLDTDPPRLGVVQVKFIQDGGTAIKIPKSYLTDARGRAYGEFFLLVCSGREDKQVMLLLSAANVLAEGVESDDNGKTVVKLGGEKILANNNLVVHQKTLALDRIEQALKIANFSENRRFLLFSGRTDIKPEHIESDWMLPLDNDWGDIKTQFFKAKNDLRQVMYTLEDAAEILSKIIGATDPAAAMDIYENGLSEYMGGSGNRHTLMFECIGFDDEDFKRTVRQHRARVDRLRELKVESSYFALQAQVEDSILTQLPPLITRGAKFVEMTVTYRPVDLTGPMAVLSATSSCGGKAAIKESAKGRQKLCFDLKRELGGEVFANGASPELVALGVKRRLWAFRRLFLAAVDDLYLGEDLKNFWDYCDD